MDDVSCNKRTRLHLPSPDDVLIAIRKYNPQILRIAFKFFGGLFDLLTRIDLPREWLINDPNEEIISWKNDSGLLLTVKRIMHLNEGLVKPGPVFGKEGRILLENGHCMQICVQCGESKQLTQTNYKSNNGKSWQSVLAGTESFNNSARRPCMQCFNTIQKRDRSEIPSKWLANNMRKYNKKTVRVFLTQLNAPEGCRCAICGYMFMMQDRTTGNHRAPSVQENLTALERKLKIGTYNRKNHEPSKIYVICSIHNVAEHDKYEFGLIYAWHMQVFPRLLSVINGAMKGWSVNEYDKQMMISASEYAEYSSTADKKKRRFYSKTLRRLHFSTIVERLVNHANHLDVKMRKKGRFVGDTSPEITKHDFRTIFISQNGRCAQSGIRLSFQNIDGFAMSIDRIDNTKPHSPTNCRIICRVFHHRYEVTKQFLLECLLTQSRLPLTNQECECIRQELTKFANKAVTSSLKSIDADKE
jgi:hypothetical protein